MGTRGQLKPAATTQPLACFIERSHEVGQVMRGLKQGS